MRRRTTVNDQRLTVYMPDGAVAGRILRFTETGLIARMEREVPRGEYFRYALHLPGTVISGGLRSLAQEGPVCRLQFEALSPTDRARLEPLMEEETGPLSAEDPLG